ncbi:hypothetical protein TSUD_56040 [Trifolium subterraneum]|uniref:F-box associated beta-propeller type 3 domain-containing protein n=1 Tax=Trifolium subterraneum TaxID=3900 RepID=A0A2Z6M379_TRISU|nr:hypothetical protein TSUD_56040 [Trifolium subterraneum]
MSSISHVADLDYFYGFGYDQSTDDYLVVSMSSPYHTKSYLEFFSLRAYKWKQYPTHINYSNSTEDDRKAGSLFNGAIHWIASRCDLQEDVIVAFDLIERKLLHMHLPDQFEIDYYCGLWVFREFLSLWNMDKDTVEIWVMKEYKVHSSWTKTHVLPIIDAIPANYFYPLCCTKSGDIVGTYGYFKLMKYNDVGQLLGCCSYFNNQYGFQVAMYTESLLSLPGDTQEEE